MNKRILALTQSLFLAAFFALPSFSAEDEAVYLNAAGRVVVEKRK
jgi:hypothetical protein